MIEDWSIHHYLREQCYAVQHPRGVQLIGPQPEMKAGHVCFFVAYTTSEENYQSVILETFTGAQFSDSNPRYVYIRDADFVMLKMAAL